MSQSARTAVFTTVSKNYLHYARTLMRALAARHPDWDRFVLLVDRVDNYFDPRNETFRLLEVEDLPIPGKERMFFRYDILELNTAAKPWFFQWLLKHNGYQRVVYFDPDIFVYSPLTELEAAFDGGALAVLTPHLTGRIRDERRPGEIDILISGTYNLGFVGLAGHAELDALLEYWCEKSQRDFSVDLRKGLFTDQKWMDLIPGLFADTHILRHEGYNVAYWNLPHRTVERRGDAYRVNGQPLVFFHFSGLDPLDPESLSRHQDRYRLSDQPVAAVGELVRQYCRLATDAGLEVCRHWPYAFDRLADGSPVIPEMRAVYRNDESLQRAAGDNPFALDVAFFNSIWADGTPPITQIMRAVYEARPDVRAAFPDIIGANREQFAFWYINSATLEHKLPHQYTESIQAYFRERAVQPANGALLGAARRLAGRVAEVMRSRAAPPVAEPVPAPRHKSVACFTGFHPRCAEDFAHGITWMGPRATVRLPAARPGAPLTIRGEHSAEPHQRANGASRMKLRIELDGLLRAEHELASSGPFDIHLTLPGPAQLLTISASSWFVPARAGINGDLRTLAVKIARIELDGAPLLDFGSSDPPYRAVAPEVRGLNVIGHFDEPTGVGQAARACAQACAAAGVPFHRLSVEESVGAPPRAPALPVNLICINMDQVSVICELVGESLFRGRHNIAVCNWELEDFPEAYLAGFDFLDEIWAPSRFICDSLSAKSPVPVVHMPYAVDFTVDAQIGRRELGLPEAEFLFLVMYDVRSYQARKNPEGAIEAFRRAFPRGGARLVVKVNHAQDSPSELATLRARLAELPGAVLIDRNLSRPEVYALEACCDAYVSLHRSEGWGFNLCESMYLGKPVIATGWSGNLDFTHSRNACLVDYKLVRLDRDHGPYRRGERWADPDLAEAAAYMRRLVDDPAYRREIGARGRQTIHEELSPRAVGERYRKRLQVIERMR